MFFLTICNLSTYIFKINKNYIETHKHIFLYKAQQIIMHILLCQKLTKTKRQQNPFQYQTTNMSVFKLLTVK